jgi:hypothetical protein
MPPATATFHQLERQGDQALASVRRYLAGRPSLEARRRADHLLDRLEGPVTDQARLQQLRALEVLELIGNPESRKLLEMLTGGAPEATLTQEAGAACRRLNRKPKIQASQHP